MVWGGQGKRAAASEEVEGTVEAQVAVTPADLAEREDTDRGIPGLSARAHLERGQCSGRADLLPSPRGATAVTQGPVRSWVLKEHLPPAALRKTFPLGLSSLPSWRLSPHFLPFPLILGSLPHPLALFPLCKSFIIFWIFPQKVLKIA